MIVVKNNTIMISKGETFQTLFYLNKDGYQLTGQETIKFNIKSDPSDDSVIMRLACGIDVPNNIVSVYATKDEMSVLEAGNYFYDISVTYGNVRHTLMYPTRFIVREVCYE